MHPTIKAPHAYTSTHQQLKASTASPWTNNNSHTPQPYPTSTTHVPNNQHAIQHRELSLPHPTKGLPPATHTFSITKELHIHTHSNNQRVHTHTHTFPTIKPFTHTHPKEFYSPSQGASYTPPRAKCFTPTQNSQSSPYRHPHKRKPQVLRFVCHSSRYLNTKTFNCDFLFTLMSRERVEEGGGGWRERAITPESFLC